MGSCQADSANRTVTGRSVLLGLVVLLFCGLANSLTCRFIHSFIHSLTLSLTHSIILPPLLLGLSIALCISIPLFVTLSEKSARRRYHIFRQHYDTLLRLRAFFPFHLIDGMGTLSECREQVGG